MGLKSWFLSDLGLGKRDTCFKMSKVRLFKMILKHVQIEYKKNDKGGHRNLLDHFEADFLL